VGEKENVLSFNREKILDYFNSHYSTDNTVVCVAGAINTKEIQQKISKYFSRIKTTKLPEKVLTKEEQTEPGVLIHYKKTDQTHFCLGVRTYGMYDERRYALTLMSIILGGNMSSRLFISVRERNGLAYYVHTSADTTTDAGYLVTQSGIKNNSLEKAVELVLAEYKDLKEKKITPKELKKAKDYLRGTMSLSLDASDTQASFFAMQEVMGQKLLTPEEKLKLIDKVTINDINKIAKDIFAPEKLNLSVIGPIEESEKEKLKALLKL
jgi:predicted Zn-dependent peptidase